MSYFDLDPRWKNIEKYFNCKNNCRYCYIEDKVLWHARRGNKENWTINDEEWDLERLKKDSDLLYSELNKGNIRNYECFFIYPHFYTGIHPEELQKHLVEIEKILQLGADLIILCKPHKYCIQAMCMLFSEYKDKILFRFIIGSSNNETLGFWEPYGPSFEERFECLKYAFENGFKTSVSINPILDDTINPFIDDSSNFYLADNRTPHKFVDMLLPYVSSKIWFGVMNDPEERLSNYGLCSQKTLIRLRGLKENLDINLKVIYSKYKDNPKVDMSFIKRKLNILEKPILSVKRKLREDLKSKFGLTATEIKVCECLIENKDNGEIEEFLYIGNGTVRGYLHSIYSKTINPPEKIEGKRKMTLADRMKLIDFLSKS